MPATVALDCDVEDPFQGHALSDPSLAGPEIRQYSINFTTECFQQNKLKVTERTDSRLTWSRLPWYNTYFFNYFCKFAPQVFQFNGQGLLFLMNRYDLISQL